MFIAVTGGVGFIGSHLVPALAAHGHTVRILDRYQPAEQGPSTETWQLDLSEITPTTAATAGADVVIHLAGITWDAPLDEVYEHNLLPTWNVLEAARRNGIGRVVLASSHHVVGFTPVGQSVPNTASAPRPDSVYGVGKAAGEALGSLYADKHHLDVVAIRIGSFRITPTEPRHAATWLSPRDGIALFHAAATQPLPQPFILVYGTSDNPLRWWPHDHWNALDYQPRDSANADLAEVMTDLWHGGAYAAEQAEYPKHAQ